jgi:hypothetical protein
MPFRTSDVTIGEEPFVPATTAPFAGREADEPAGKRVRFCGFPRVGGGPEYPREASGYAAFPGGYLLSPGVLDAAMERVG